MHVVGAVTDIDAHAQPLEIFGVLSRSQIGARHVELQRTQDFGQPTHADAADADEVHVANAPAEHQTASWNESGERREEGEEAEEAEEGGGSLEPARAGPRATRRSEFATPANPN